MSMELVEEPNPTLGSLAAEHMPKLLSVRGLMPAVMRTIDFTRKSAHEATSLAIGIEEAQVISSTNIDDVALPGRPEWYSRIADNRFDASHFCVAFMEPQEVDPDFWSVDEETAAYISEYFGFAPAIGQRSLMVGVLVFNIPEQEKGHVISFDDIANADGLDSFVTPTMSFAPVTDFYLDEEGDFIGATDLRVFGYRNTVHDERLEPEALQLINDLGLKLFHRTSPEDLVVE